MRLGVPPVLKPGTSNQPLRPEEVPAAAEHEKDGNPMPASRVTAYDHIRPRPVNRIPDLAPAPARKRTAAALESAFGLSPEAARRIADAVVNHSQARDALRSPERRRVPGGELIMVATDAWAARLGADPTNMRAAQDRVHPFAVAPGTGAENSRFAPVRPPTSDPSGRPELVAAVESRVHLAWAYERAREFVLAHNDWTESIAAQGVMEAVWVTPVRYRHADTGSELVVAQSSEGSSRVTATHHNMARVLNFDPANALYDLKDTTLRSWVAEINNRIDLGNLSENWEVAARAFVVPALFVVGFEPADPADAPPFHVAVQSLVALRHVDPPAPWGESAEMEALADGVLDELERRRILRRDKRRWLAGSMTRAEAVASHFSDDPGVRTAHIVELFTSTDPKVQQAIRAAVTAQSTRRQIRNKLKDQMAAALIMRAVADGDHRRERVRKYLREGVGQDWHRRPWKATQRSVEDLEKAALAETAELESIDGEPGPASLELAARAMFPLITGLHLHADRGTANNDQPDRRNPGQVLDAMRRTPGGVRQLARALRDGAAGNRVVMVDDKGQTELEGARTKVASDAELRRRFPHGAKTPRPSGAVDTPAKQLAAKVADLSEVVGKLPESLDAVAAVVGDRGGKLVEDQGIAATYATAWIETLEKARDRLMRWKLIHDLRSPDPVPDDEDNEGLDVHSLDVDELDRLDDDQLAEAARALGCVVGSDAERDELLDAVAEALGAGADDEDLVDRDLDDPDLDEDAGAGSLAEVG